MPSSHLILCCPLLLLPSIFPSIRLFSSESVLHIRWPKYWTFSFSISPSNEHPGLISFRMDCLDLLAVQGTLKESSPTPQFKSINSGVMMGSKMVSASRVIQVVKPHTPLIRFPDRRDNPKPNVSEVLRSAGLPSHTSSISQHSKGSKSPDWLMHRGPPDTAEIIKTLPQKYRRKFVSQEETEFIQRGGPE